MWPWSTIAKLRSDLREARDDAERFSVRCGRANQEAESIRQRWTTLNESYETLTRTHNQALDDLSNVRDGLQQKTREAEMWEESYQKSYALWDGTRTREAVILSQLAEAQRNDKRDPKTGRFVKSNPTQPGVTTMGKSSVEVGH